MRKMKMSSFWMILLYLLQLGKVKGGFGFFGGAEEKKVDRIVVVMRHGDRAPMFPMPYERELKHSWPMGYGHLTPPGKLRMFRSGQFLKRRYSKYFPDRYISPRDVYIRSSAVERCLESAQLVAAGLCPPSMENMWNNELGEIWQPVPIYSVNLTEDGLLYPSSNCPKADKLFEHIQSSPIGKSLMSNVEEKLIPVALQSRFELPGYRALRQLFDNLLCAVAFGHRPPHWLNDHLFGFLDELFWESFKFDYSGVVMPELRRLRAGVLLNEIFERLNPDREDQKLTLFMTHDSQIVHLMDALNIPLNGTIKFGMMLMFESSRQGGVRLFAVSQDKPTDHLTPYELHFPGSEGAKAPSREFLLDQYRSLFLTFHEWLVECFGTIPQRWFHFEL